MPQLHAGNNAPDFTLLSQENKYVRLADFVGHKVLLYFYPRAMTPGCTIQACSVRDNFEAILKNNITVLGLSPDKPDKLKKFAEKYDLPFPLLSDDNHQIAEAYGAWDTKSLFSKIVTGIIRSSFLIDESGIIIDCWYKVKPGDTVPLALQRLKG